MKVLDIGCTAEYNCNDPLQVLGESIELFTLDVDPTSNPNYVQDIREPIPDELYGKFDVVFMSHVLEHVERANLPTTLLNCYHLLKIGGEFWVYVPSLEWACREVLAGNESIVIQGSFYGGQKDEWDIHKAAYTLPALKSLLHSFNFTVRKAGLGEYLSIVNGKTYTCKQNVIVGVKNGMATPPPG